MRVMQPNPTTELTCGKINISCAKCDRLPFYQYFSSILYIISISSMVVLYCSGNVAKSSSGFAIASAMVFCIPVFSLIGGLVLSHIKFSL